MATTGVWEEGRLGWGWVFNHERTCKRAAAASDSRSHSIFIQSMRSREREVVNLMRTCFSKHLRKLNQADLAQAHADKCGFVFFSFHKFLHSS
jgi:hypothetical protein